VAQVSLFESQNRQLWFSDLGLKITATISWFGPQNHGGFGLSVAPQNRRREDGAGNALRSAGLLRLKESRVRIFQSGLKTTEARWRVVHVAPLWRLRQDQVEDGHVDAMGCVGPCYLYFTVFLVLGTRSILVFYLSL
jgi:hypothetical protein